MSNEFHILGLNAANRVFAPGFAGLNLARSGLRPGVGGLHAAIIGV
jgi:hypothetical protein